MVMQDVNHQLFYDSVENECRQAAGEKAVDIDCMLEEFDLLQFKEKHPMALSGGQKQRLAIATALLSEKNILIFDEPTSGLDPLMQNRFVELILEEKQRGKTILMSSHIFEEVEKTCDRAVIIRQGSLVAVDSMEKLCQGRKKRLEITFAEVAMADAFANMFTGKTKQQEKTVELTVGNDIDQAIKEAARYIIKDMNIHTQSLEEFFLHFYGEKEAESANTPNENGGTL